MTNFPSGQMGLAPSDVSLLLWPHLPIPRLGGWGPRWQWLPAPPPPPCRLPGAARRCFGQLLMEALFTFSEILWRSMPRLFSLPICQGCSLPHLLTQIYPGISDHLNDSHLLVWEQQNDNFWEMLLKDSLPSQAKKKTMHLLFSSIWEGGVELKFLDVTFFSQGLFLNHFRDEVSFEMYDINSCRSGESLVNECPASCYDLRLSLGSSALQPDQELGQGLRLGTRGRLSGLYSTFLGCNSSQPPELLFTFFSVSSLLLLHYLLTLVDAFFFFFGGAKSLCSLLFSLLYNIEAQKNKLIFSMAIGLSNPESSWILVYIQGTLSDPFLLLLHWSLVSAVFQLLRLSDEVPSYLWHISLGPNIVSLGSGPVCS